MHWQKCHLPVPSGWWNEELEELDKTHTQQMEEFKRNTGL
jgi:hypothetical protein